MQDPLHHNSRHQALFTLRHNIAISQRLMAGARAANQGHIGSGAQSTNSPQGIPIGIRKIPESGPESCENKPNVPMINKARASA
jgi:hypothetical protein